jgi:hypothetical protein
MVRSIKNIIAAILISVSAFLSWTNILPKYDYYSALKITIESRQALLKSREGIFEKVSDLQKEYQQKYAELQRMGLVIPEKKNLPEMISTIDSIFSNSGLNPGGLTIGGGKGGQGSLTDNVIFDIVTESTYESLINLLTHIEKNIRLIDVSSLTISVKIGDTPEGSIPLSVQLKGSAYYLKPLSEIVVAPVTATPPAE